ncbi:Sulfate transporter 2.1 [Platanthera zijinensis]|uniref:Sulfate transporter 2.1 n=1 Tax=Platanthera zijinensis TaxID=2320716 RepID=A0AAP0BZ44_9ASPA
MDSQESLTKDFPLVTKDMELSEFPQTLQQAMASAPNEQISSVEEIRRPVFSVLNTPDPPAPWKELASSVRVKVLSHGKKSRSLPHFLLSGLQGLFPVLRWGRNYCLKSFQSDIMAGLTLASLGIPQSIGYASLAKLEPQYGLYTNLVPPLVYAVMGTSREIAIGPVAVVSLLISSMIQKIVDPSIDSAGYKKIIFTVTFFTGVFQACFGFFRLGFLVNFLSHAAIVGFMGGAAIVIGLQQLKGLLGLTHFTNKTDLVSVIEAVWIGMHQSWHPSNFFLGCFFLIFILVARFLGRRKAKLFWLQAIAPLISVILSTVIVFLFRGDRHGLKIIKDVKSGLNPSSVKQLQFTGPFVGESAKIGVICAVIALTEAVAVGRSFASVRGYQLDGNKEMIAMGFMNIIGSLSSCYVATGSFSRTAVNFFAGCKSPVSNIIMAVTVFITLEFLTRLLYYTPVAILASIILSALPGLIDVQEAWSIWKIDKMDFLACVGAFIGVLIGSVEIGLLLAVIISFARIMLSSLRPRIEALGRVEGTNIFCSKRQYPISALAPGLMIIHIGTSFLCFINANFTRERVTRFVLEGKKLQKENIEGKIQYIVIDMSNVMNIDSSGIAALEEIHSRLESLRIQVAVANPGWQVIHKMKLAGLVQRIGDPWIFLTVGEAVEAFLSFSV